MFGNEANAAIDGLTLTMTPYETPASASCGAAALAPAPAGAQLMGTAGGGNTAAYIAPTVALQYLPSSCRP